MAHISLLGLTALLLKHCKAQKAAGGGVEIKILS